MNPDAYMPYYGNDFEQATKGHRPETKWAYLCAVWHYWHHTHCQGLPNDDDRLRGICEVDMQSWARVRGAIFGTYFLLEGGLWHQGNARKIYNKWNAAYQAKVAGAAKTREIAAAKLDTGLDTAVDINQKPEPKPEPKPQPDVKPDLKQKNDERSAVGPANRSSCNRIENDLMAELKELLGNDEIQRAGGAWRVHWARKHPDLLQRALADLRVCLREGREIRNRGAWVMDLLKRWK